MFLVWILQKHTHGSHSQRNIIFQDIITIFQDKEYKFLRQQVKKKHHLFNGWSIVDIFMVKPPPHSSSCLIHPLSFKF